MMSAASGSSRCGLRSNSVQLRTWKKKVSFGSPFFLCDLQWMPRLRIVGKAAGLRRLRPALQDCVVHIGVRRATGVLGGFWDGFHGA
jgi:hypothetical protein